MVQEAQIRYERSSNRAYVSENNFISSLAREERTLKSWVAGYFNRLPTLLRRLQ